MIDKPMSMNACHDDSHGLGRLARWLCYSLLLFLPACDPSTSAPRSVAEPSAKAHRLALLVGVGEYPGDSPQDLPGPANDIVIVEELLRERFGFPEESILTLVDAEATHAAIIDAFRKHLIAKAAPNAEVVFWYCGHGSRIQDASKRELHGLDNSLVAVDSRARSPDGAYDISDDELHTLLQELATITDRIVLVTDSCHSGSSFRGSNSADEERAGVRFASHGIAPLSPELVAPIWQDRSILDDDSPERRSIERHFVHIAACAPWELAGERKRKGRAFGLLTWHLVRALERAQPDETWRQVIEQVQLLVREERAGQTPSFDGHVDRRIFGGEFVAPPKGIPARMKSKAEDRCDLELDSGQFMGLELGSKLSVYRLRGEDPLARAVVTRLLPDGLTAQANWLGSAPELERGTPLRVIETERPMRMSKLTVASAGAGLAEKLGLGAWVAEVPAPQAKFVIEENEDAPGITLRTPEGVPIWPSPDSKGHGSLDASSEPTAEELVKNALRFQALMRLPLQRGGCEIEARFVTPTEEELTLSGQPAAKIEAAGGSGSQWRVQLPSREPGVENKALAVVEITSKSRNRVHVALLSLVEAGFQRNDLFGALVDADSALDPGEKKRVLVHISRAKQWPLSRPMLDRYVVIATPTAFDVRRLSSWKDAPVRSGEVPLPNVLRGAFEDSNPQVRGFTLERAKSTWGATWLDLHVR
jgi:hypothetical protein